MENENEVNSKTPIQLENTQILENQLTPPPSFQTKEKPKNSGIEFGKNGTPDRLKVPKAFKYSERYTSPTDLMVSPVTKGVLARTRKAGARLPPAFNQIKVQTNGILRNILHLLWQWKAFGDFKCLGKFWF
ncbi:hypothetical protein RJ641_006687 [Dillenia turbinata]|uniref:Uncharacterized protein n=1 Tax=Dillenia turbinata TaxID=194707 RepID=A0AAN8Z7T9_9MAGN